MEGTSSKGPDLGPGRGAGWVVLHKQSREERPVLISLVSAGGSAISSA